METILILLSLVILFCAIWSPVFFDLMGKAGLESNIWILLWLFVYIPLLTLIWINVSGII